MKSRQETLGEIIADAEASAQIKYEHDADPAAVEMHACIYEAIAVAKVHGHDRRSIERRARMGIKTLGDYLSCKPERVIKVEQLARMLFDPAVLGYEGHKALHDAIALRGGRRVLMEAPSTEHDGMLEEVLDVGDAGGALMATVRDAVHPDSPGGTSITPAEQIKIGACGRVVIDEALAMIPWVNEQVDEGRLV